jgi:ATP-dependent Clp protease ATP-binding subunit ClpA
MLRIYSNHQNRMKNTINHFTWHQRPLSITQQTYCAEDVVYLFDAFDTLRKQENISLQMILRTSETRCQFTVLDDDDDYDYEDNLEELKGTEKQSQPPRVFRFDFNGDMIYTDEEDTNTNTMNRHNQSSTIPSILINSDVAELNQLIRILPPRIQQAYQSELREMGNKVIEIVLDIGRNPFVRISLESAMRSFTKELQACSIITHHDLEHILQYVGNFTTDNRCGLNGTLHRISRKLNKQGKTIAFTIRVGRMIQGLTQLITDLIKTRKSVLLIGMPGVGKTTLLREYARVLAFRWITSRSD